MLSSLMSVGYIKCTTLKQPLASWGHAISLQHLSGSEPSYVLTKLGPPQQQQMSMDPMLCQTLGLQAPSKLEGTNTV